MKISQDFSYDDSIDQWESFDDYFDFYITSAMESSIPEPIYRDYQKLVDE
jgi:hypothetical protein